MAKHLYKAHKIEIVKKNKSLEVPVDENERPFSLSECRSNSESEPEARETEVPSQTPKRKRNLLDGNVSPGVPSVGPMDKCLNRLTSFTAGGSRDAASTDALLYMISKDSMPLATTERKGFRHFVRTLQPLYTIPCEPTVTKKLEAKYEYLRERVKVKLKSVDSVCLTTDLWTEIHTMRSYLGVTVHFLDGTNMRSVELCARPMTERKTIQNLSKVLREICNEWGIEDNNISAIVTDGGANIKGAIREEFGPQKHLWCLAHLINGIGQAAIGLNHTVPSESEVSAFNEDEDSDEMPDGMIDLLKEPLKQVKKIVKFFRQSEVATSNLMKLQKEANPHKPPLKLIQEVCTRWNSCFDMLDRFLQLANFVSGVLMQLTIDKSSKSRPPNMLSGDDLESLTEVRDLLRPLWQVTKQISKEKSATLSLCIPAISTLKKKVDKFMPTTAVGFNLLQKLKAEVERKLSWFEQSEMYAAACVLDPRFKKEAFTDIAACSKAVTYIGKQISKEIKETQNAVALGVRNEAQAKAAENNHEDDFWSEFDATVISRAPNSNPDTAGGVPIEFRQYLSRQVVDRKENPNPFVTWKAMKSEYMYSYRVMLKYLPILATSVPSERLFSHAGRIVSSIRNKLSPRHVDMLVFLRSVDDELWFE